MTSSVEHRLRSWRELIENGGPAWLVELAPHSIRELEDELAREKARALSVCMKEK